jgi:hypothetical protein
MFSPYGRADYDETRIRNTDSLLHVLARAGLQIRWRDNQAGCKGVCAGLPLSAEVRDLFARIFVIDSTARLTVEGIAAHPWCTAGGPPPPWLGNAAGVPAPPGLQGAEDINRMVAAARVRAPGAPPRASAPAADDSGGADDFEDALGGEDDAGFD